MLKSPYKKYNILHIYNIEKVDIIIDDPDLIGVWEEADTLLLFFHKNKDSLIKKHNFKLYFYSSIPYFDWESGKFIKQFKIGNFLIKPVWEEDNGFENIIKIDPSVVFGSGFHPTTRMILESFNELTTIKKFNSCIDLGAGTGILGIFAGKKGIQNILSVDNNNLAYEVMKKNFMLNNISATIIQKDIFDLQSFKTDIIFANLYYNLLLELFKKETFWFSKYYFFSGFIKKMENKIYNVIKEKGKVISKKEQDDWVMMLLERNN